MKAFVWQQKWNPDFVKLSDKDRKDEIRNMIIDANGPGKIQVTCVRHVGNGVWRFKAIGSDKMIGMLKELIGE